jgi:uncharacterized protein YndB with AHSA1/START domain
MRVARRLDAPPDRVFDAWLDPDQARHFLFATPTGTMVRAELDPHVGGRFNLTDRRDGEDVEHAGTYEEIDRPRRLVFTYSVPKYSSQVTKVTVEIVPMRSASELTLTQDGVAEEYLQRTREGWTGILDRLAATLTPRTSP